MSTPETNRQLLLARHPEGRLVAEDFRLVDAPIAAPADGQLRIRTLYLSIDPTMRVWLHPTDNYLPMIQPGDVFRGIGIGVVEASRHPAWPVGRIVHGLFGCQERVLSDGTGLTALPDIAPLPLTAHFSLLGHIGATAYCGLLGIGAPKAGDTLLVSGAAGAVGSLAGQIGRILGCRVVGTAGGADKCRYLTEQLGFDAAVDYRAADYEAALRAACPSGVDVYFDNVGGRTLELALGLMNDFGRIVCCGMIAVYDDYDVPGPRNLVQVVLKRLRMQGFVILDPEHDIATAFAQLGKWASEGRLQHRAHVIDGLERLPDAINMLLDGRNQGKLMVRLSEVLAPG